MNSLDSDDTSTKKHQRSLSGISLCLLALYSATSLQAADIAKWDFFGETSTATSSADVVNAHVAESVVLTRGPGAALSAAANSFRSQGFANNGIALSNTDYFQTTISAKPGYALSLSSIDASVAGTTTYSNSPGTVNQFAYSLDGSNFTLIGSPHTKIGNGALPSTDTSAIPALQEVSAGTTITLRFYASGQTSTGGWGFFSATAGSYGLAIAGSITSTLPALQVTVSPPSISENGGSATGTVTRGGDLSAALTVHLSSSNTSKAIVPASIIIPANAASADFAITAQNNSTFEGTQLVTITATDLSAAYLDGTASLSVTDDDPSPIVISQYYEGTSSNKYIELHNTSDSAVSLVGYRLTNWTNAASESWKSGAATPTNSFALDAITIPAHSYWLICGENSVAPAYANPNTTDSSVVSGFNGNDSLVLYFGTSHATTNIIDAISLTNSGNEGADQSFYRLTNAQGYSLTTGSTILDFPSVWAAKTLAEVDNASSSDAWYLQSYALPFAPVLDTFVIGAGATTTVSPQVTIAYTSHDGVPLQYRISELADLSDAPWLAITAANRYEISSGNGPKTVYFQLRNATGSSAISAASIERSAFSYQPSVIISQYYEPNTNGGNSKYIELSNISESAVNMSAYSLVRWTNQDAENWKLTGATISAPSSTISLAGLGTLAAGQTVLLAHTSANTPVAAASAQLTNGNLNFTGNDSIALYHGTPSPATLSDVVSFTNLGNEGADLSYVRQNHNQGFSFASGSNVTGFATVWVAADFATVADAAPNANEKLGIYPGGGATPFMIWAAAAPYNLSGNDALFDADPDHDGIPNGIEYITGGNPTAAHDAALSAPQISISGADESRVATVTYRHNIAADYLHPQIQISDDLEQWTPAINGQNAVITVSNSYYGYGINRITVTFDATGDKNFARLSAEATP